MKLLYHENRRHYIWSLVVMAATTFLALDVPLNIILDINRAVLLIVGFWVSCAILMADVMVRLRNYRHSGISAARTRNNFWIGWILFDLIPAIPFGPLIGTGVIQLVRLLKIIRVGQFLRQLRQSEVRLAIFLSLGSFAYWVFLLIHWLTCGWLAVYHINPEADLATNYISALYWTMTTLTAVGYGDIVPITNLQRLFAMLVQVTGIAVFGYLIGNVVTILTKLDAGKARFDDYVDLLTTALRRRGLSKDLQRRVMDYYRYVRDDKTGYDETAFLNTLPPSLRTEVALNLKKEFIEGIPLFRDAEERFIIDVALKLELVVATPGDYIFKADDPANDMYFVISGELQVLNKEEDQVLATLTSGDFFGEIALFKNIPRSATIRAVSFCNLYQLRRSTFEMVVHDHPEIANQMEKQARFREQRYFEE